MKPKFSSITKPKPQFLEPLPVKKKTKQLETEIPENLFKLEIPNMMDLSIRKDFTPWSEFIDFIKGEGLENELYGPALM